MLLTLLLAAALTPRIAFDTPALEFDFPAVHIGVAEYDEGPTGATVFYFPTPVMVAVDVRGGSPGTIATDSLRLAYDEPYVDAITFAGGSSYGLSVATGAAEEIKSRAADAGDWSNIATVAGAIIFDLGGRRYNTIVPDAELGRSALRAARPGVFPLGGRGAGRFATQSGFFGDPARQHSGQGAAFRQVGQTKVAVFTVVNSLGAVVDRSGTVVRCAGPEPCGAIADRLGRAVSSLTTSAGRTDAAPTEATTLTLVVTNEKLPFWALQRLAVQVHTSMSRAIQPFHTTRDGDVLFAASTSEVDTPTLTVERLGVLASEAAWDAVLSSVPPLDPAEDRPTIELPKAAVAPFAGTYEFAPGATATVTRDGAQLYVEVTKGSFYFEEGARIAIDPVAPSEFIIRGPRRDRLRFERDARGRVTGLTVNPGQWPLRAQRTFRESRPSP